MTQNIDITNFIKSLIEEHGSLDVAEAEFKRIVADDTELRNKYKEWCELNGTTERNGFSEFAEEYQSDSEEVWSVFDEYNDDSE